MEPLSQQTPWHTCCPAPSPAFGWPGPASPTLSCPPHGWDLLPTASSVPRGMEQGQCHSLHGPDSTHPSGLTPRSCLHPLSVGRAELRAGFEYILYYLIYFNSKFSGKSYFRRSVVVCEVWLGSVNSLISPKRTARFLILLPLLIDLLLQNTIFLVKIDPRWPNSPQMRHSACFELGRSIAAGQQNHFSCFFGLLKNLEVWGFALTLSFPCARLSRPLFAPSGERGPSSGKHQGRVAVC